MERKIVLYRDDGYIFSYVLKKKYRQSLLLTQLKRREKKPANALVLKFLGRKHGKVFKKRKN